MTPGTGSGLRRGFRSILCPVDFSDASQVALQHADAIARRLRASLHVLYVNDPLLVAAAAVARSDRGLVRRSARELDAFVRAALPPAGRLRRTGGATTGRPAIEIARAARRRADLIVIGSQGLTGAERLLTGTTAVGVLQRTSVPVVVVPRRAGAPRGASWPGRRILAALDLAAHAGDDVARAVWLAQLFECSLLLAHVVPDLAAPAWIEAALSARHLARIQAANERLQVLAAQVPSQVEAKTRVLHGGIGKELAALARTERARLVVTALRERRGWFGPGRGAVSYQIVAHADVPTLAYPPRWRPPVR